ncbi:hypothetical protein DFR30_0380 [Thiogranum longum]|uniref:Uncharacterized protein n=1 Tax=Thiogranum longum TaxID=1537524 RepID=A0A4R1HD38_9GAMM|nr:hypothetical protein DFR30_0380 [Thiogranum longum]
MNRRLYKSTVAPAPHLLENVALDPTRPDGRRAGLRHAPDATPDARSGTAHGLAENTFTVGRTRAGVAASLLFDSGGNRFLRH